MNFWPHCLKKEDADSGGQLQCTVTPVQEEHEENVIFSEYSTEKAS